MRLRGSGRGPHLYAKTSRSQTGTLASLRPFLVAARLSMSVEFSLFLGQGRNRTIFRRAEGGSPHMTKADGKDVLDREHAEKMLYSGRGLTGGGQLEIRIEISAD